MESPPPLPPQQPAPAPAFSFPQDHELVLQYLRPKLDGSPLPAAAEHFFHHADVYAHEPSTLASLYPPGPARTFRESQNWYFFCAVKATIARDGRKPRIVAGGKGTWKAEKGEPVVDPADGIRVGCLERFVYTPKPKQEGRQREWLMVEFSLDQELAGGGEPSIVLCKIYRSPRFLSSSSKSLSSSASVSKCKRKAAADELPASARKTSKATHESTPARRQLLFPSPPAPILQAPILQAPTLQAPTPQAPILQDDEAFVVDDQFWNECSRIGELSDLAPNPPVQVDDLGDQFWSGLPVLDGGEPSVPWSCSMMTAASTPWCGGTDFWNSSIATL